MRHVLTNVLGAREQVEVQVAEIRLSPGALYLLCSDGLYGMMTEERLEQILREGGPLEALAKKLIQAALDGGGHDNITALLIRETGEP
jgi:protein phosphatase